MKVMIVEDQPLLLQVLKVMVTSIGGEVVREASAAEEALEQISEECDVILMDVSLPGEDGIWCTQMLRSRGYRQPIIMVTSHECAFVARAAFAAGAQGYLYKSCSPVDLSRALRAVLKGGMFVQPTLLSALKSAMA